jgi:protein CpxP
MAINFKIKKMKGILVVALLSLSISGIAQGKKNRTNAERPQFTAQQQNELQVKKLTLELDLSADQQKQIAEIVSKNQLSREAMKTELKAKKASDKKITSDDKFVLKRNLLDDKIAYKSEMKKVLTMEQWEKWEKMPKKRLKKEKLRMKRPQRSEK